MVYNLPFLALLLHWGVRMVPITDVTFQADIGVKISSRSRGYLKDIQMKVHKLTNVC